VACARGCCPTQAEHYRSVGFASSARFGMTKVTTHQDNATTKVDVTEHWGDRQDVLIRPETLRVTLETQQ
jgi:hypothetical protein